MKNSQFLSATYLFNVAIIFILIAFRLQHLSNIETLFYAAMISQLLYAIPCMVEINRSTKIPGYEKVTWIIGMLCITVVAGGIYIFSARKRIASSEAA
jgi:uncharacterized membrane protein YagU involved in acid resistance